MAICHTVRRGDTLWSLAGRYLGSGAKWPAILERHNREALRPDGAKRLLFIKNPNLIYVGQYILIPGDHKKVPPGTGNRHEADKDALPFNLKITYTIGRETPPIVYVVEGPHFTITSEVSGEIAVELASSDRFVHSLELGISKDESEAKLKLKEAYDPAVKALTTKPEIKFSAADGKVTIESPITAEAGLGPFTVKVQAVSPMHMSGTLSPPTIHGEVEAGGRKYKYSADLEFKVNVVYVPRLGDKVKEPVGGMQNQFVKEQFVEQKNNSVDWYKIGERAKEFFVVVTIGLISAAGVIAGVWHIQANGLAHQGASSITPFIHTIAPNDPRNQQNAKRNQDVI